MLSKKYFSAGVHFLAPPNQSQPYFLWKSHSQNPILYDHRVYESLDPRLRQASARHAFDMQRHRRPGTFSREIVYISGLRIRFNSFLAGYQVY